MQEFRTCYGYDDIFLVPRYSSILSRSECDPSQIIGDEKYKLPIIMSPMDMVCGKEFIKFALDTNMIAPSIHRYYRTVEEQLKLINEFTKAEIGRIWVCVGSMMKDENKKWAEKLYEAGVRKFLIDLAHGESIHAIESTKFINENYKDCLKICGAVVTKSGFWRLQENMRKGDGIRVGIGSGQICATSGQTAFGVPQVSAIQDCFSAKDNDIMLIADGGIRDAGCLTKAMSLGANAVMCGKILASTHLAIGQKYDKHKHVTEDLNETTYRCYRGMASRGARKDAGMAYSSVEGVEGLIPYSGKTEDVLEDIHLNLQSALSYCGERNWKNFQKKVKIIKVASGGFNEKQTHVLSKE